MSNTDLNRYIIGSTPMIQPNIDLIEDAIKNGLGARFDIGKDEYAEAVKSHNGGFYVKHCNGFKCVKSPKTFHYDLLKEYMQEIAPYYEWKVKEVINE